MLLILLDRIHFHLDAPSLPNPTTRFHSFHLLAWFVRKQQAHNARPILELVAEQRTEAMEDLGLDDVGGEQLKDGLRDVRVSDAYSFQVFLLRDVAWVALVVLTQFRVKLHELIYLLHGVMACVHEDRQCRLNSLSFDDFWKQLFVAATCLLQPELVDLGQQIDAKESVPKELGEFELGLCPQIVDLGMLGSGHFNTVALKVSTVNTRDSVQTLLKVEDVEFK